MDDSRFDTLVRSIAANAAPRRAALRLLVGGALGGLLIRLGLEEAAGACLGTGKPCADGDECCSGRCSTDQRGEPLATRCCLAKGKRCKKGGQCCSGICKRKTGTCSCLAAGKSCTAESAYQCCSGRCTEGVCEGICPTGQKECDGRCIPVDNCCRAGDCTGGKICQNNQCVCDLTVRCGTSCFCTGGKVCRNNQCVCDPNGVTCGFACPCAGGAICSNFSAGSCFCDFNPFGTCGTRCSCPFSHGTVCVGGRCTCGDSTRCGTSCSCPTGRECCSGTCRDLQTDENACGECGKRCDTGQTCVKGACCANNRVCGDSCCTTTQTCLADGCCVTSRVCGTVCCPVRTTCTDPETGTCEPIDIEPNL